MMNDLPSKEDDPYSGEAGNIRATGMRKVAYSAAGAATSYAVFHVVEYGLYQSGDAAIGVLVSGAIGMSAALVVLPILSAVTKRMLLFTLALPMAFTLATGLVSQSQFWMVLTFYPAYWISVCSAAMIQVIVLGRRSGYLCDYCGYDLTGVGCERCPECGQLR